MLFYIYLLYLGIFYNQCHISTLTFHTTIQNPSQVLTSKTVHLPTPWGRLNLTELFSNFCTWGGYSFLKKEIYIDLTEKIFSKQKRWGNTYNVY